MAHLNNAGAALMPEPVLRATVGHLELEAEIGGYEAADRAAEALAGVYDAIAELIGCHRDEVAVVENATRAWDMAFYGFPFTAGDRVLVSESEYGSNVLALLQVARRHGVVPEVVPSDESGQLSVDALRGMLDERVRLVAVTHVPTQGGLVNPVEEVGAACRAAGVPFLLDACQSVGQLDVDVGRIGCDVLSATGRKFLRAPRGTGFLYVRRELLERLEPPFVDIHAADWTERDGYRLHRDGRRFENWEGNVAGRLGLRAAVRHALGWGLPAIEARAVALGAGLREALDGLPGVRTHDLGVRRCAIVSFTVDGVAGDEVQRALGKAGVNVSVSRLGSGASRFDFERRGLAELVRASPHYYNTEEEVDRLASVVARLAR